MDKRHFADKNVRSLLVLPASLIATSKLNEYLVRAMAGEDVYAYAGAKLPEQPAFWNIWDGENIDPDTGYKGVRIELGVEHG